MSANANKHKQTFSFTPPAAQRDLLARDVTHWQKQPMPLHKQPNGVWKTTTWLAPGTYHYRFLVAYLAYLDTSIEASRSQ